MAAAKGALASSSSQRIGRRSQVERRDEAERRLLEAAVQIVATDGMQGLTLADVGEAAGYSRGLPAHYFGSKDGLISVLAELIVGAFEVMLERAEKHAPGFERLLGTVSFYFDSALHDPRTTRALFVVLGESITNPVLKAKIASLNAHGCKVLERNIKAGIVAGDISRTVSAKAQATLILSGMRGAVALWLADPAALDLKAMRNEFVASLKRNLAP
jgi:AcrR family transcriptional regulator